MFYNQMNNCSYLEELTSFQETLRRNVISETYEQIVPGVGDDLNDIEASLYMQTKEKLTQEITYKQSFSSMLRDVNSCQNAYRHDLDYVFKSGEVDPNRQSVKPPSYDDHLRSLQNEETRVLASSPSYSDVSAAGVDTSLDDLTDVSPNETSTLLTDIMECIETVDKCNEKGDKSRGN